jgi:hypothetical protein
MTPMVLMKNSGETVFQGHIIPCAEKKLNDQFGEISGPVVEHLCVALDSVMDWRL